MFARRTKTGIKHMSKTNVGANLVFARRTKTDIKPMFDNELEPFASDIGSQTIIVRRANIRFAPTLVLLICLILVFVRGEHKVRPTRRITKYILLLLRSIRKFMTAYLQFRGSEFHTRNDRSRQLQEQRRAKAHSRQAKANSL